MMDIHTSSVRGNHAMARPAADPSSLYKALEALPDGLTGEILHGQIHTQPRPAARHILAASNLGTELIGRYSRGRGGPGGWWILDEPELHFLRDREVLVPNLAGWRRKRMPHMPDDQRFEIVPDWVCEILSPSSRSKDREIKMPLYARYGVAYMWLLDPEADVLEAYELRSGNWEMRDAYSAADRVAAAPFEAAAFQLAELWT